ncbi:MAG: hypothetical protein GXY83_08045 [Rhodopirellula sp.]|nr:hypothetical protein [Rhodopirellula sp.]
MSGNDSSFEVDLRLLLANGKKIEAIKLYRERTGAGLAEAKEAVEAFEQGESLPKTEAPSSDVDREVVSLLEQGKKIQAIKVYRERTGVGLKEAKDAVDAIAAERHILAPSGSGCLGIVLLFLMVVLTFYC